MSRITRRLPSRVKRLAPVVRERDALRARVTQLETELERERAAHAGDPAPVHGTYIGDRTVLVAPTWGGRLLAPSDDLSLTPELVATGGYDGPFTAFVQHNINPGDTVFDVGANIGLFTILAAYQVWEIGRVIAYEPCPRVLEFLRDNVTMNWLNDRVTIVPKAVAATHGVLPFLAPSRFTMTGSLRPVEHLLASEDRVDAIERIDVEAEPLDVHVGRFERIDLIKIDVEGAEEQVFAGMTGLLESGVVRRVSFEVSRELMGDDWPSFASRLHDLEQRGWSFATITAAGGTEPIAVETVADRGRFSQVLMTRESVQSR